MAKTQSTFPTTIDSTLQTDRASGDAITSESYDVLEDAVFELETKVGVDSSAVTGSIDYKIANRQCGKVVQIVYATLAASAGASTQIPVDSSIPQSGEGTQVLSASITPTNASNILKIEVELVAFYCGNPEWVVMALFQDTTANALAANGFREVNNNPDLSMHLTHFMAAGTTSSTTFKVRAGTSGGSSWTLGDMWGAAGLAANNISITEFKTGT